MTQEQYVVVGIVVAVLLIAILMIAVSLKEKPESGYKKQPFSARAFFRGCTTFLVFSVIIGSISFFYFSVGKAYYDSVKNEQVDYGGYTNDSPDPIGPGVLDSGVHPVEGYYRSDGTYVDDYMRSDPDGFEGNNLNP